MLDRILNADAKGVSHQIKSESVDMIFTDPVYSNIDDYIWLAEEGRRVLKPGGVCLVWVSSQKQFEIKHEMARFLNFCFPLYYVVQAKAACLNGFHLIVWTTPILAFFRGKYLPRAWIMDTYVTNAAPNSSYKWNKNLGVIEYYLTKLCEPGGVVWDPFTGYGSVPVVCLKRGYHFLASEIDPVVCAVAVNRTSYVENVVI